MKWSVLRENLQMRLPTAAAATQCVTDVASVNITNQKSRASKD